jgi:hypothetical protein
MAGEDHRWRETGVHVPGVSPRELFSGYNDTEGQPLGAYASLAGLFFALFGAFLWATERSGRPLPGRMRLADVALIGVATHKLSWIVANSSVTSFVRAPVTELEEVKSPTTVEEKPRGEGLQKALGGLLTCHFCLGMWIAAFLSYGSVLAPRATRFFCSILAVLTVSDFLHQTYKRAIERAQG